MLIGAHLASNKYPLITKYRTDHHHCDVVADAATRVV